MIEIAALISAIGTFMIAIFTGFYTYFSRKTINELRLQNELLKKEKSEKYILERKAICKKLLIEINHNQAILSDIDEIIKELLKKDSKKIIKKMLVMNEFNNILKILEFKEYENFLSTDIDFKDDSIYESMHFINYKINDIKNRISFFLKNLDEMGTKIFKDFINRESKIIKRHINDIDKIYIKFENEIGYNIRKSGFFIDYKTLKKPVFDPEKDYNIENFK